MERQLSRAQKEHLEDLQQFHAGRKRSMKTKKRISKALKGRIISEKHKKKISKTFIKKGQHLSPQTEFKGGQIPRWIREKAIKNLPRGEKHWNWKGGIAKERDLIKISPEYKEWREFVFERDNYTCQKCSKRGNGSLNAHHVKSFRDYSELRFDTNNGKTLCEDCHNYIHSKELIINQYV